MPLRSKFHIVIKIIDFIIKVNFKIFIFLVRLTAVLCFPSLVSEISATKSDTELPQARKVSPMMALSICHINPSVVKTPTTSFAIV